MEHLSAGAILKRVAAVLARYLPLGWRQHFTKVLTLLLCLRWRPLHSFFVFARSHCPCRPRSQRRRRGRVCTGKLTRTIILSFCQRLHVLSALIVIFRHLCFGHDIRLLILEQWLSVKQCSLKTVEPLRCSASVWSTDEFSSSE